MKRYEPTSRSQARDLYAAGFRQGDEIVIETPDGGEIEGTLVGQRVRGYPVQEFGGPHGHATEILINRGGRTVRVQFRKAVEIRSR